MKLDLTVKMMQNFTCYKCGKVKEGTTKRFTMITTSTDEVKEWIDGMKPISSDMPVGWLYNNDFFCEECK